MKLLINGIAPPYPAAGKSNWFSAMKKLGVAEADYDDFIALFHAMDAPGDLQGLSIATESFLDMLSHLMTGSDDKNYRIWEENLIKLQQCLQAVADQPVAKKLSPVFSKNWRGVCTEYPLYAFLITLPGFEESELAASLYATVLPAFWQFYNDISPSRRAQIGTAMRALFDYRGPGFKNWNSFSGMTNREVSDALLELSETVDSNSSDYLNLIGKLLLGELGIREGQGGGAGGACEGIRGKPRVHRSQQSGLIANEHELPSQEIQEESVGEAEFVSHVPQTTGSNLNQLGVAPADLGSQFVLVTESLKSDKTLAQHADPARRRAKKKAIKSEISARVQPIPFKWQILTPVEVNLFLRELARLAASGKSDGERHRNRLTASIILLGFLRGVEPATILKMRFLLPGEPTDKNRVEEYLWFNPETGEMRLFLSAKILKGSGNVQKVHKKKVLPMETSFSIAIPSPFVHALFDWLDVDQLMSGKKMFRKVRNNKKWNDELAGWMRRIQRKNRTRITLQRLWQYFPRRAAALSGIDRVSVAYVRGKIDLYSQNQAYYTALDTSIIEKGVAVFWKTVFEEVIQEGQDIADSVFFQEHKTLDGPCQLALKPAEFVGSGKVPTTKHVQQMVQWMQENIVKAAKIKPLNQRIVAHHNAFTLYSLIYFLWGSGYRAVNQLFPDPRLLDQATGLMAISDKDAEDGYSTRLVWIEEECREQLQNHFDHIEILSGRLAGIDKELFQSCSKILQKLNESPPALRTLSPRVHLDAEPVSPFFIYWRETWIPLTPRRILDLLDPEYRLPVNSNRHYTRTHLLRKNVREELIDTHLGHWHHGLEPLAPQSAMAPVQYAKAISPYLREMLSSLGFRAIKSMEVI